MEKYWSYSPQGDIFECQDTLNGLLDAKTSYHHDKIIHSGRDMKAMHGVMNEILQRMKECKLPTHTSGSANDFALFFKGKIDTIRAQILALPCGKVLIQFADAEIHRIIAKSPTKGCSLDPMPTWMVTGATEKIVASIKDIVNISMLTGKVLKSFKMTIRTPLLKKLSLDPEVVSNY